MIKSEIQKNRTLKHIQNFKKELHNILESPEVNDLVKETYKNSYEAIINDLAQEIEEYEERKAVINGTRSA